MLFPSHFLSSRPFHAMNLPRGHEPQVFLSPASISLTLRRNLPPVLFFSTEKTLPIGPIPESSPQFTMTLLRPSRVTPTTPEIGKVTRYVAESGVMTRRTLSRFNRKESSHVIRYQ